jgi:hypothetical protein
MRGAWTGPKSVLPEALHYLARDRQDKDAVSHQLVSDTKEASGTRLEE